VRPLAKLDRAETIVTIDCDLFVEHPAAMRYSRDFAKSRRKDGSLGPGKMNRLYAIESVFSNTGAMADHRLALRSELGLPFAVALDAMLTNGAQPPAAFLQEQKIAQFLGAVADELKANTGKAIVIAGRRQPPEVHALVAKINQAIGAVGATLDYIEDPSPIARVTCRRSRRSPRTWRACRRSSSSAAIRSTTHLRISTSPPRSRGSRCRSTSPTTRTRRRTRASGTCRARTSSRRGATRGRGTARSRSRSR